jgi:hypothetical protein
MSRELWVAGYPSSYGGADTELDHNIDLWRSLDFDVHLVPMHDTDPAMLSLCDARGSRTHRYAPEIFADEIVISFCNGSFLEANNGLSLPHFSGRTLVVGVRSHELGIPKDRFSAPRTWYSWVRSHSDWPDTFQ